MPLLVPRCRTRHDGALQLRSWPPLLLAVRGLLLSAFHYGFADPGQARSSAAWCVVPPRRLQPARPGSGTRTPHTISHARLSVSYRISVLPAATLHFYGNLPPPRRSPTAIPLLVRLLAVPGAAPGATGLEMSGVPYQGQLSSSRRFPGLALRTSVVLPTGADSTTRSRAGAPGLLLQEKCGFCAHEAGVVPETPTQVQEAVNRRGRHSSRRLWDSLSQGSPGSGPLLGPPHGGIWSLCFQCPHRVQRRTNCPGQPPVAPHSLPPRQ